MLLLELIKSWYILVKKKIIFIKNLLRVYLSMDDSIFMNLCRVQLWYSHDQLYKHMYMHAQS